MLYIFQLSDHCANGSSELASRAHTTMAENDHEPSRHFGMRADQNRRMLSAVTHGFEESFIALMVFMEPILHEGPFQGSRIQIDYGFTRGEPVSSIVQFRNRLEHGA
ncbi:hypothetical protein A3840_15865 [Devosia elaeis]|uniref:Uncharacterized protein n=1 Tax=Devosia elaeis TaxID=1770058 RepID=A0A178HQZ3_9HYPH|nr:hypothetical protein A3840_15865 [Devosia elaeis]